VRFFDPKDRLTSAAWHLVLRYRRVVFLLGASAAAGLALRRFRNDPHFVAIALGIALVWTLIVASRCRGSARNLFVLAASVLLVPALAEGAFAVYEARTAHDVRYSKRYYTSHPILGYGPVPSQTVEARNTGAAGEAIYDATYTIDENGIRRTLSGDRGPTFAFFFDSFAFGEGVDDGDTLPQIFADLGGRRFKVINLGFQGYGPQAFLRTLETGFRDALLAPAPVVFIIETAIWHAERAACRVDYIAQTPRYVLRNGALAYRGPCVPPAYLWLYRHLFHSYIYTRLVRPLLLDRERDAELYIAELCGGVALARRKYDAPVVVLYLRSEPELFAGSDYTDDEVMDRLGRCGATVIDGTPEISPGVPLLDWSGRTTTDLQQHGDGHPSPKGQRLIATRLYDAMKPLEDGRLNLP
jgi:hypothetical protein